MLNRDPPDHTRLRKLVSKAFTPRRIENLRPRVQELVDQSLDRAAEAGELELIGDFAFPLPFAVISEMLGIPLADADQLRKWSGTLVRTLPNSFKVDWSPGGDAYLTSGRSERTLIVSATGRCRTAAHPAWTVSWHWSWL